MSRLRIKEAGDSAVLVEFEAVIDVAVNARAVGMAAAVRQARVPGVQDVVSTFRSVAVYFDPLRTSHADLIAVLERSATAPESPPSATVEIPVVYGGEHGPDLDEVARLAGLSPRDVVARHAAGTYRVFMLGFLPGFAYMGTVDEQIAMPRLATPRVRVPAGAVGIAGRQTGIYPRTSPGGWRLIGRTALRIYDAARAPAALLAPGDSVRFVPVAEPQDWPVEPEPRRATLAAHPGQASVTVLRAGLFTTVQDTGRWGQQRDGVSVSGAMDMLSHRTANAVLGNDPQAATLEVTLLGPELRIDQPCRLAVAGADLGATLDGAVVPRQSVVICRAGSVLRFGARQSGARAYVAFDGGVDVAPILGSRSTHAVSGMGGLQGRALVAGDRLPLGSPGRAPGRVMPEAMTRRAAGGARVRVLPGPQDDCFPPIALDRLQRNRFTISPRADRMGYRLGGADPIGRLDRGEMISDATFAGGVQVPPSGDPIVLLADRQVTGGYPQLATVITADLPVLGQLAPGDWVEFDVCTRAEAVAALAAQEAAFSGAG